MSATTGYVILGVLAYITLMLTLLTMMELANRIERKYALRQERHPDDPDKGGDEA